MQLVVMIFTDSKMKHFVNCSLMQFPIDSPLAVVTDAAASVRHHKASQSADESPRPETHSQREICPLLLKVVPPQGCTTATTLFWILKGTV